MDNGKIETLCYKGKAALPEARISEIGFQSLFIWPRSDSFNGSENT